MSQETIQSIPWNAFLAVIVLFWSIGSLAFVERLRRTFATPQEIDNVEKRLCGHVEGLAQKLEAFQNEVKSWEREFHAAVATKNEVKQQIDGLGSRVNNLDHMFTTVHKIAEDAKDRSKETQADVRHLADKVTRVETQNQEIARKLDSLMEFVSEVRVYMRETKGNR